MNNNFVFNKFCKILKVLFADFPKSKFRFPEFVSSYAWHVTKDTDNDQWSGNCAVQFHGVWWYDSCHASNLNGKYLNGSHSSYADGVNRYH